jgi:predicted dehydrogenase
VTACAPAPGSALGFAIVGCGAIARTFAGALEGLEGARLVAVNDIDGRLAERFAAEHGPVRAMGLDDLLAAPDVDVVCVCVPSGLHAEIGLAAAKAGKHVVVEKPIDVNLAAARRLVESARAAGVSLTVISQERYNPGARRAKALLEKGALGDPLLVAASVPWYRSQAYYDSAQWRGTWDLDGGGAFMNQGVHYADLLCWMLGPPQVESASCATVSHDIEVEDVALALLRFQGGALGTLEAATVVYPGLPRVLRVTGTKGTVVLQDETVVLEDLLEPEGHGGGGGGPAGLERPAPAPRLQQPLGHRAELADVVAAIREGREPPVTGEDGCRALELVLDVYRVAGWGPAAGRAHGRSAL